MPPPVALAWLPAKKRTATGRRGSSSNTIPVGAHRRADRHAALLPPLRYFEIQITTPEKGMHASLAKPGQGPVEAMLRLILRISRHLPKKAARPRLQHKGPVEFALGILPFPKGATPGGHPLAPIGAAGGDHHGTRGHPDE